MKNAQSSTSSVTFREILNEALTKPGIISQAYSAFHSFSIGNQLLAAIQLAMKGLPLSPIASFGAWKDKGRAVKKGEKAISLWMPVTIQKKDRVTNVVTGADEDVVLGSFKVFKLVNRWFSLDQTQGEEFAPEVKTPTWNKNLALTNLGIAEVPFNDLNGNVQGYATGKSVAVSPVAVLPHKTRFHELAHVVLGHTVEAQLADSEHTPRDIREVEAESVAYLLISLLNLPGQVESRGYIQSWLGTNEVTEKSAQRIFSAAQKILRAGQEDLVVAVS